MAQIQNCTLETALQRIRRVGGVGRASAMALSRHLKWRCVGTLDMQCYVSPQAQRPSSSATPPVMEATIYSIGTIVVTK